MKLEGRGDKRVLWLTAVEVPVAAAGGALDGCRVAGGGGGCGHEFPTAVERVAAESGGVVLQAFLVYNELVVVVGGGDMVRVVAF